MISDLTYISKNLYISNQVEFKLMYSLSSLSITTLYIKSFYYLINILIYTQFIIRHIIFDKANIHITKKS